MRPYGSFGVDDLVVRVHSDTAVVRARATPKGQDSQGEAITGQYRIIRAWVKRNGCWQVPAFHGTHFASS